MKVLKEYEDVETEAMRYGTLMHEAAENYVRDKTPLGKSFEYVKSALDALASKTGKSTRYADKSQLELMALGIFKHFPVVKTVKAGLLFVVCNELIKESYVQQDQTILWDKWMSSFTRMDTALQTDVWNANPSGLCKNHCPVIDCVHNGRN